MPVLDVRMWRERRKAADRRHVCNYVNRWQDAYAFAMRKLGLQSVWPVGVQTVLDAGCGDGRLTAWMATYFRCRVDGFDAFDWPGAKERIEHFWVGDVTEQIYGALPAYDLVTAIGSLSCSTDFMEAVRRLGRLTHRLLIVENTQDPTPLWLENVSHRKHTPYGWLLMNMVADGWKLEDVQTVTVLDKRLFIGMAGPIALLASLAGDLVLRLVVLPERARFTATLWVRGG